MCDTVKYPQSSSSTIIDASIAAMVTMQIRGQCSNFVDGENFDGMIPDRSGDFDDQSIDFDPVWCARARGGGGRPAAAAGAARLAAPTTAEPGVCVRGSARHPWGLPPLSLLGLPARGPALPHGAGNPGAEDASGPRRTGARCRRRRH